MSQDQPLEFANVGAQLVEAVAQSKRYAITHVDSVGVIERFTSADVASEVRQWAELVREKGLEPGDRVIVLAGRAWEWRCALLGVLHAGGVAVPCSESTPVSELRAIAAHAGAALVVSIPARPDLVEEDGPRFVSADQLETVDAAKALAQPPHPSMPGNAGLILYARSATGFQGTVHTHASLIAQADAGDHWLGIREGERVWCTAADGSAMSIWLLLAAWRERANIVTVNLELDPEAQLELLERLRPAALWFSDEEYGVLASEPAPPWIDLGSIRRALVSDDSAAGAAAFEDAFGTRVTPLFGLNELGVVAGWPAGAEDDAVAETAIAVPGIQLAIVDERGSELPAGEVGDVVVRGDAQSLFSGYAGGATLRRDSWIRLGWRGALAADRSLRLASRPPLEIELVEADVDMPGAEPDDEEGLAALEEAADELEPAGWRSKREAKRTRRREERQAREREKAEAHRRREEEKNRELAERAAAKEREEAERAAAEIEERRREEELAQERQRAEAAERAEREAAEWAEREAAAEERRRAEEAARAAREAAEAAERQRAKEAARAERVAAEAEERRRAEAAREEREAAEAAERRRAEEVARAEREAAERAEREAAEEEERRRAEAAARAEREAIERAAREAAEAEERRRAEEAARAEREAAEAEERRRAEEAARAEREAAEAEERRRAEEERRRAEEEKRGGRKRRREEKQARRREEQLAKERQKAEAAERAEREAAEAKERRRAEEAARVEERRRAEDEKRGGRRRRREEKRARRQEEQLAKERQKAEAAERAEREAAEAEERRRAEEAARAEDRRRAENEKQREGERRREEKEARRREEREAKEAARAHRKAARAGGGRRAKELEPTVSEKRRRGKRRPKPAEQSDPERLSSDILSRINQYGMTPSSADPDAEAVGDPPVGAEKNERQDAD